MADSNPTSGQPPAMIATAEALLQAYEAGQRNFMGLNLGTAQLSHANLRGADLSYTDLSMADLSGANLRGADLSYANLRESNLQGADLRGAMLIGTDLREAVLQSAQLDAADFDPVSTHFPERFNPVQAGLRASRQG